MTVFITRKIPEIGLKLLTEAGVNYTEWLEKRDLTQEELVAHCANAHALLSVGRSQLPRSFFQQCGHLKVVSLFSVGYDSVDIEAAKEIGIPIGNTPDVLSKSTADVAFLLMQMVARKAVYHHNRIARSDWDFFEPTANLGMQLDGKTLGIYGLGKIGIEMAKRCYGAFNMKIIYHSRSHKYSAETMMNARYVSFDELLEQSDILSVHMPLLPETKEKFNAAAFSKMKPTSIFINTARGGLHKEADLIQAIENGNIWGAGLDVTNPEPMAPDNPLLNMPTVAILPHIGSATIEARNGMAEIAAKNVIAGLKGEPLLHEVR